MISPEQTSKHHPVVEAHLAHRAKDVHDFVTELHRRLVSDGGPRH